MKRDRAMIEPPHILSGWKEIAAYLGKGVRTVQRYELLHGFPIRRPAGRPSGSVVATTAEIDAWVQASPLREELLVGRSESLAANWAAIRAGTDHMVKLVTEMRELRRNLKTSLRLLHESVSQVREGLNGDWKARMRVREAQMRKLFTLLHTDTVENQAFLREDTELRGRKAS